MMEDGYRAAAATLAVAILENQPDQPNHRPTVLTGTQYQDRLLETYFDVLEKIRTAEPQA